MNRPALTHKPRRQSPSLLPPPKPPTGRPAVDPRRMRNGSLWRLHTSVPWHAAFAAGARRGAGHAFLRRSNTRPPPVGHSMGTSTLWRGLSYGPPACRWGNKRAAAAAARRRSPGSCSPKGHGRAAGQGTRMTLGLTPGQGHAGPGHYDYSSPLYGLHVARP
jgi:hypothetical protein